MYNERCHINNFVYKKNTIFDRGVKFKKYKKLKRFRKFLNKGKLKLH